ncbi:hypothetical protein [Herpetosiphon giganteus]|uniref:hypothetical protein n=1 Tax=Herpetosiphon giganteus TaxID=2029754 RepID=UPI0019574BAC|nr:hypothetical protein [Herpetosiphon giganteus]MBM7842159.1 hypothetical protein [Herpetosiphon giganteus]
MRQRWQLGYGLLFVLLVGCGETASVAFGDLCQQANNGKLIKTEGYLVVGSSIFCSNIGSSHVQCELEFVDDLRNAKQIAVLINEGTGKNQIVVPENYSAETIVIHDDSGAVVKLGEKVQLAGEIVISKTNVCLINTKTIKRLP